MVRLLDWFDLEQELILVLERPAPCMDLVGYMNSKGPISERKAKVSTCSAVFIFFAVNVPFNLYLSLFLPQIIAKQLVHALMEIESKGVFHRDIKLENILIETGSPVPRVRIIDFGCGTHLSEGFYTSAQGMPSPTDNNPFL